MPGAFSPDLVWTKARSTVNAHWLFDVIRGTNQGLSSSSTTNELTRSSSVTAFGSTGFTLGTSADVNSSAHTYVAWCWDAGEGDAVTNTQGSITSTVSVRANATAGFSIVKYAGASGGGSWGHGLGVEPKFIIFKRYTAAQNWFVFHKTTGSWRAFEGLNNTNADGDYSSSMSASSTVVTLPNIAEYNTDTGSNYIAYCFAPVAGYSSFGSYTGNGSSTDGPFVYTGFRPRWVLFKNTNSGENWRIMDAVRNTYNVVNGILYPNLSNAEGTSAVGFDILSNGFKIRETGSELNASGATIIYAAFAEAPFNYARAR
jgi:hypothetical protein